MRRGRALARAADGASSEVTFRIVPPVRFTAPAALGCKRCGHNYGMQIAGCLRRLPLMFEFPGELFMTVPVVLSRRSVLHTALGTAVTLALASPGALAQKAYPSKPLRWIIAYPAGGGQDFLARHLSVQMGKQLGQSVVIDNRPQDRNYVAFVVVEETFGSIEADEQPPKVLHTAFKVAINGSLTYVPQSLFDEEIKSRGKRDEFVHDFGVFVRPKPGEPVFGSIELAELATESGRGRLVAALHQFQPELITQFLHQRASKPLVSSR